MQDLRLGTSVVLVEGETHIHTAEPRPSEDLVSAVVLVLLQHGEVFQRYVPALEVDLTGYRL